MLRRVESLHFAPAVMRGVESKREVLHYGLLYGYDTFAVTPGPPMPEFLEPLRERAAAWIGVAPEAFEEVLVTRYPPGAGIGWHRDAPMFGDVVGISLGATCNLRFREGSSGRATFVIPVEHGSAYLLSGVVRNRWQHNITPVKALRYSITFRTVRRRRP